MADRTKMERPMSMVSLKLDDEKSRLSLFMSIEMKELLEEIGQKWDAKATTVAVLILDEYIQEQLKFGNLKRRKK